jgi:hypothetical protein
MENDSRPTFFLGELAQTDDPRLKGPLGSDIGKDETGKIFLLHTGYRGQLSKVLEQLAKEKVLDLNPQPTTLLSDGSHLLQEREDTTVEEHHNGRRVRQITEEEMWDSNFLKKRRKRAESGRIERTVENNKLT